MRRPGPARDSAGAIGTAELDALFSGRLTLLQPPRGYRVNVDTLLLAGFATAGRPRARRVVDLGAGVGALGLAYAFLGSVGHIDLVERDPALARLSAENLARAGATGESHVADLEGEGLPRLLRGTADVVLSNPPFFPREAGTAAGGAKSGARSGPLAPFLRAAEAALGRRAYAFFAYPAPALPSLLAAASATSLVAKRLRFVHAFVGLPARLALIELRRAKPGGLVVEAPLIEWAAPKLRSPEVAALLSGDTGSSVTRRAADR
jgi:tRNA1Val (adenine37-N6)-methyltransferase